MSIKYPTLANAAGAGMIAGIQASKLSITNIAGSPVSSSDFAGLATASALFAAEVDAAVTALTLTGQFAGLISASGVTQVPATAAESNGAETLPSALGVICFGLWFGRSLPTDPSSGLPFTQADYAAMANNVVALLVALSTATTNT